MVWHAGSPTGIVHADLTLTRSMVKVKIKVTGLLKFRKLSENCTFLRLSPPSFQHAAQTDGWS